MTTNNDKVSDEQSPTAGVVATNDGSENQDAFEAMLHDVSSSYQPEYYTFERAFEGILKISTDRSIHAVPLPPRRGATAPTTPSDPVIPPWSVNASRFKRLSDTSKSIPNFKSMFARFFKENRAALIAPIFIYPDDDDGASGDTTSSVNDAFFKQTEKFPVPGGSRLAREAASGPVIYANPTQAELSQVNLPIGEVYRAVIAAHLRAPSVVNLQLTPVLTLLYLYACIINSFTDDDSDVSTDERDALEKNLFELCEAAEATSPGSGPCNTVQSQAGPVSNPMDFVTNMLQSMGGAQGSNMASALTGAGGLFQKIMTEVTGPEGAGSMTDSDGAPDICGLIDRFGKALQKPEIRNGLTDTSNSLNSIVKSLPPGVIESISSAANATVEKPVSTDSTDNVE